MNRALFVALLAILLVLPSQAQPATEPEPEDLTAQITKLNATLEELVGLMRQQVEGQTLDLLMQRIQLSAERVEQTERDLREVQKQNESYADEKLHLEQRLEMFADQVDRGQLEESEMESITSQLEGALERLVARSRSADREIAELEATLGQQRQDLREWQDFVDDRLSDL